MAMGLVVVVERDRSDRNLWRYGEAGPDGKLADDIRRLRYDPATGTGEYLDPPGPHLPTAILVVRRAGPTENRLVWDVTAVMFPSTTTRPTPPPASGTRWARSTAGKAKGKGETLAQRASRGSENQPGQAAA